VILGLTGWKPILRYGNASYSILASRSGTGIGFSAILDGRIVRGVHGAHPELCHIPILLDGPSCYCGIRGCFESLVHRERGPRGEATAMRVVYILVSGPAYNISPWSVRIKIAIPDKKCESK